MNAVVGSEFFELSSPDTIFEQTWVLWREQYVEQKDAIVSAKLDILCTVNVWTEFWEQYMKCIAQTPALHSLHVFKTGITPVYQDNNNCRGGHYKIRPFTVDDGHNIMMYVVGQALLGIIPCSNHICGVSLAKKSRTILVKLWLRDSKDKDTIVIIQDYLSQNIPRRFRSKFCPNKYMLSTIHRRLTRERSNLQTPPSLCVPPFDYFVDRKKKEEVRSKIIYNCMPASKRSISTSCTFSDNATQIPKIENDLMMMVPVVKVEPTLVYAHNPYDWSFITWYSVNSEEGSVSKLDEADVPKFDKTEIYG